MQEPLVASADKPTFKLLKKKPMQEPPVAPADLGKQLKNKSMQELAPADKPIPGKGVKKMRGHFSTADREARLPFSSPAPAFFPSSYPFPALPGSLLATPLL